MTDMNADTIRVLVSTDNHVGYNERDHIRGDDSWKTFDEIMRLAKDRDVDMILLAGDLFHENKPSRKAMYQVMQSLRKNCIGDKPCSVEMLSDGSEQFAGTFNHANFEDEDINVGIPVFSIHGNHDDPSGEGHLAALDILQMSGLLNYYGRTPESDNILIRPVLLQKGRTKLALYGMSNVRDERLFRTFRDGNVRFFRPGAQKDEWFNLMSVHQNHHAYTDTGFLPEEFLPSFLDLVVWGHEHECKIDPITNPDTGFKVMQPGSSVATSLVKSESVPKHVAILSITGKEFEVEPILLKTVRPFVTKDIVLKDFEEICEIAHRSDNKAKINQFLTNQVNQLIEEATQNWLSAQDAAHEDMDEDEPPPLPLIRLRVENTPPEGGKFEFDNPQRFSNRFVGKVANVNDVIQYHRKRTTTRSGKNQPEMPEDSVMAQLSIDTVKVEKFVKEFLSAQSLTILPQNSFSDAVGLYIDKDDKFAMDEFVNDSLQQQVDNLLKSGEDGDDFQPEALPMEEQIEKTRRKMEQVHTKSEAERRKKAFERSKPENWDSDENGHWANQALSSTVEDNSMDIDDDNANVRTTSAKTKGVQNGRAAKKTASRNSPAPTTSSRTASAKTKTGRAKAKQPFIDDSDEDEEADVAEPIVIDDDDDSEDEEEEEEEEIPSQDQLFVKQPKKAPASRARKAPAPAATTKRANTKAGRGKAAAPATTRSGRQTQLSFASQANTSTARSTGMRGRATTAARAAPARRAQQEPSDDEISDDNAFEPPPAAQRSRR